VRSQNGVVTEQGEDRIAVRLPVTNDHAVGRRSGVGSPLPSASSSLAGTAGSIAGMTGGMGTREVLVGERVLTFDGRVLDVFNGPDGALRVHVRRMRMKVEPTRKSRLYVQVTAERRNTPREIFEVEPEDRPAFEELVAEIAAARERLGLDTTGLMR